MMKEEKLDSTKIIHWYNENKRILPWRMDKDPYHVWISEVMLQQTRIESVKDYYQRFLKEVPTIHDLALISEDKLLKLWEGLGYYSRARNLKKAAIIIEENYQGKFPSTYDEIKKLPGIGEYTASAISSICFHLKEITVDGNVLRVYTRFFDDRRNIDLLETKKNIREELGKIVLSNPADFNEGMMELGEVVCIPKGVPLCQLCPLKDDCLSRKNNCYELVPVRSLKNRKKEFYYVIFIYRKDNLYAIEKRNSQGMLKNMWQFPMSTDFPIEYQNIPKQMEYTHVFTHQKWHMTSYLIDVSSFNPLYTWKSKKEIEEDYAIPSAFQPFLKNLE